jgi:RimJ/RimL family protein N-acetyltransferase
VIPIPLPDPPLADDVVELVPWAEADVDAIVEHCNDPAIAEFTFLPIPYERKHALAFLRGQDDRRERGEAIDLAIRDRDSGELLGAVGMRAFREDRASVEVGYWVAPAARGKGAAPRAVRLMTDWALANLPLRRIDLPLDHRNEGSRRVAEKSGFKPTGERRRLHAKGRDWLMDVYAYRP